MSTATGRPRRLPIFFVIDDSDAMAGYFQVVVPEALQTMQRTLAAHPIALRSVYLSALLFGQDILVTPLQPIARFTPLPLRAQGGRPLHHALRHLRDALHFDLIATTPERRGDTRPMVFLVLGDEPDAAWQETLQTLLQLPEKRAPFFVTVAAKPTMQPTLSEIPGWHLQLRAADGESMTAFFAWATTFITQACEASAREETDLDFPLTPPEIQQVP
jgi:uncharacterized protein YegL